MANLYGNELLLLDSSIESCLFGCDARRLVSNHGCWPYIFFLHASFLNGVHPPCVRDINQTKCECTQCLLCISRLLFFLFPLCASESTPTKFRKGTKPSPERAPEKLPKGPRKNSRKGPGKSQKGPRTSPERAPDQVPKGPRTVRKHPRFRLE